MVILRLSPSLNAASESPPMIACKYACVCHQGCQFCYASLEYVRLSLEHGSTFLKYRRGNVVLKICKDALHIGFAGAYYPASNSDESSRKCINLNHSDIRVKQAFQTLVSSLSIILIDIGWKLGGALLPLAYQDNVCQIEYIEMPIWAIVFACFYILRG